MRTSFLFSGVLVAATTVFAATSPAFAYSITSNGNVVGINSGDIGDYFNVNFGGSVERNDQDGLTGRALFTFNDLREDSGQIFADFSVSLTNNSSNPITNSRISALGFNSTPDVNVRDSSSSGLFNLFKENVNFPNGVGRLEAAACDGGNCTGGGSGGVTLGNTGNFNLSLAFDNNDNTSLNDFTFNLEDFHVRYQSIDGDGLNGASGTGDGTIVLASSVDAPEPLTILGTGMAAGFGAIFRKEKQKKSKQKAKIEA